MQKGKSGVVTGVTTGVIMKQLWLHLVRDFRKTLGPDFFRHKELLLRKGIKELRLSNATSAFGSDPYLFKCVYQMESLFKRFRFADDLYSDAELSMNCQEKFLKVQQSVCRPSVVHTSTFMCVQRARQIAKSILGQFDPAELVERCYFGSRASVGVPFLEAYLDKRLKARLSGSQKHIEWFRKEYLPGDELLRQSIEEVQGGPIQFDQCANLNFVDVPKSFKARRGMMPNTTIGGLYTNGLGKYLRSKLEKEGLRLDKLQPAHKALAKGSSLDRKLVTLDLSSASDLFTPELVNRLLPREWYNACKFGRISKVNINKSTYHMCSFMSMGLGHTFPLQTLLFYSILKSIAQLTGTVGKISVYGDDLIYPRRMHYFVLKVFEDLNFEVNKDKSYASVHFRESCGGDYYQGVDVRPYSPEGEEATLTGNRLAAFCYGLANGLRLRWDDSEIPTALFYLQKVICGGNLVCLQVPPSYPDTSGWKVASPIFDNLCFPAPVWNAEKHAWMFAYLGTSSKHRPVLSTQPYLWESLRAGSRKQIGTDTQRARSILYTSIRKDRMARSFYTDSIEILVWKEAKKAKGKRTWKVKTLTGERYPKLFAFVVKRDSEHLSHKPHSVSTWM